MRSNKVHPASAAAVACAQGTGNEPADLAKASAVDPAPASSCLRRYRCFVGLLAFIAVIALVVYHATNVSDLWEDAPAELCTDWSKCSTVANSSSSPDSIYNNEFGELTLAIHAHNPGINISGTLYAGANTSDTAEIYLTFRGTPEGHAVMTPISNPLEYNGDYATALTFAGGDSTTAAVVCKSSAVLIGTLYEALGQRGIFEAQDPSAASLMFTGRAFLTKCDDEQAKLEAKALASSSTTRPRGARAAPRAGDGTGRNPVKIGPPITTAKSAANTTRQLPWQHAVSANRTLLSAPWLNAYKDTQGLSLSQERVARNSLGLTKDDKCIDVKKSFEDHAVLGKKGPTPCYGMCGNGCNCWKYVCGNCCQQRGCLMHDGVTTDCTNSLTDGSLLLPLPWKTIGALKACALANVDLTKLYWGTMSNFCYGGGGFAVYGKHDQRTPYTASSACFDHARERSRSCAKSWRSSKTPYCMLKREDGAFCSNGGWQTCLIPEPRVGRQCDDNDSTTVDDACNENGVCVGKKRGHEHLSLVDSRRADSSEALRETTKHMGKDYEEWAQAVLSVEGRSRTRGHKATAKDAWEEEIEVKDHVKANLEYHNVADRRAVKRWQGCADGEPGYSYCLYRGWWFWRRKVCRSCSSSPWYRTRMRHLLKWWNNQAPTKARRQMRSFLGRFSKHVDAVAAHEERREAEQRKRLEASSAGLSISIRRKAVPFNPDSVDLTCSGGVCSIE